MRRTTLIVLLAVGLLLFLAVSALLARVWSGDGAEQAAVTALVQDEARGDASAMITAMTGCSASPACRAQATVDARALERSGSVSILDYTQSTGFSLTSTLGSSRVSWEVVDKTRPITQCIRVRRAGNALSGIRIELLKISLRLKSSANCPARF